VYCSAAAIAYSDVKADSWANFAKAILDGLYDATLAVAALTAAKSGKRVDVYLTCVGGGVFKNDPVWINDAIQKALMTWQDYPLNVKLVH